MTSSDSQLGSQPGLIDIHGILQMLPHRYPFLLLDRVLAYELDTYLHAIKNVTINEPFFQGHFPARPVLPGVLILEAIAQSSAILASMSPDVAEDRAKNMIFLFAGIDNARFKRPVEPGDQLLLNVQQTHYKKKIWKYSAQATVEGVLAASADIIFTYKLI